MRAADAERWREVSVSTDVNASVAMAAFAILRAVGTRRLLRARRNICFASANFVEQSLTLRN
jgi:hypothetical protein